MMVSENFLRHMPRWIVLLGIGSLFVLLAFLAFGHSLWQGYSPIDDSYLIEQNLAVRGPTLDHLKTVFTSYDPELYIPLTFVSYQLDYLLSGLDPAVYHLTNILLQAANGMLIAWLLFLLSKKKWLAVAAGLLFTVHPLHTEAVVWLAGRKDLLATFFFLLAYIFYLRYRSRKKISYAQSILFFFLALLSKALAITLPAVLLLSDLLIERRRWSWQLFLDKIPYAVLSAVFIVIAAAGKQRILSSSTPLQTILMSCKSTIFYLEKILLPVRLSVFYPFYGSVSLSSPAFYLPAIGVAILIALALYYWGKNSAISFGIFFFLVTLTPTFLNFHKGEEMYFAVDRYAYLPSIGILFLLVCCVIALWEHVQTASLRQAGWITFVCILGLFCVLSIRQTQVWDSPVSLESHALALYPQSVSARVDLASYLRDGGQYQQAFDLLKAGLTYGDNIGLRLGAGYVYARVDDIPSAIEQFQKAMTLSPQNPEPHFALGSLDEQTGHPDEAEQEYQTALRMDPSYVIARTKLAAMLVKQGKTDEARQQLTTALQWNPNSAEAHTQMAALLDLQKKTAKAYAHLQMVYALKPDDVALLLSLAEHAAALGKKIDAIKYADEVLQIDAQNVKAKELLQRLE